MTSPAAMTEPPCNKTALVLLISDNKVRNTDKENEEDGKKADPKSENGSGPYVCMVY